MADTILVVEDESALSEILANILEYCGYAVFTAGDGLEALEAIKQNKIDLIISDYMMPRFNGIELHHRICADQSTSGIPMIMMSALPGDLKDLPVYAILNKPFQLEELMEKVTQVLNHSCVLNNFHGH